MLQGVKQLLYEIMTMDDEGEEGGPSIKALQQNAITLGPSMRNRTINVFNLQNVVQHNVRKNVVLALQKLESLDNELKALPDTAFRNFIRADIKAEIPVEKFIHRCLLLYVNHALAEYGDAETAAKKIEMPLEKFLALYREAQNIS